MVRLSGFQADAALLVAGKANGLTAADVLSLFGGSMSSDENKLPRSPKATSSSKTRTSSAASAAASSASSSPSSAETIMDQHIDSPLIAPSAPPIPPEVMSSTVPAQSNSPADPVPPKPPSSLHAPRSNAQASNAQAKAQADPQASAQPKAQAVAPESAQASEASVPPAAPEPATEEAAVAISRQQPIPPASEPMQYRAIGLVRGKYQPSEEQFTRGTLFTDDGTAIDAVLLGRVMSLVKKHLNLEQPHLWVVYPRTNEREYSLHVQIVGVWEPENLKKGDSLDAEESEVEETEETEAPEETEAATEAAEVEAAEVEEGVTEVEASEVEAVEVEAVEVEAVEAVAPDDTLDLNDRYFSVRGEVVHHVPENEQLLVKIRRAPRQGTDPKAFKVVLKGKLEGKVVGYFWDFNVHREADVLVIQDASLIKIVPPQKGGGDRPKGGMRRGAPGGGVRKPWSNREGSGRPTREGGAPRPPQRSGSERPSRPTQRDRVERPEQSERKEPISKPIIKRRDKDAST